MRGKGLPGYGKGSSSSSAGGARGASKVKRVANSRAAKDAKKVAKVGVGLAIAKTAMDKSNKKMDADLKRYQELMRKYKQSAAYGNISFEKWLQSGGK